MNEAIEKLSAKQATVAKRSAAWMVAEQLKDICRHEPESAALIAMDLDVKGMGIADAEKQIKAFADSHKTGSFACVTPIEAEDILRKFYGLPERKADEPEPPDGDEVHFDLSALMG